MIRTAIFVVSMSVDLQHGDYHPVAPVRKGHLGPLGHGDHVIPTSCEMVRLTDRGLAVVTAAVRITKLGYLEGWSASPWSDWIRS